MSRIQKNYDHQLRDFVRRTGDSTNATRIGVPRSTAAGWLREPGRSTVTLDALSMDENELQAEVLRLRRRVDKLRALARILVATIRSFDLDLSRRRIPDGRSKWLLLRALDRSRGVLRLRSALGVDRTVAISGPCVDACREGM